MTTALSPPKFVRSVEAKLTLIKWLDPGTTSPESLVEPFKKLSGLLKEETLQLGKKYFGSQKQLQIKKLIRRK
ncbi:MAG: hypothetical protein DCF14_05140 [Phormidesmis priestleyi]|nr:MAG: hypothetical protein DCF14_05140 [Phormidesmis priestleyi]